MELGRVRGAGAWANHEYAIAHSEAPVFPEDYASEAEVKAEKEAAVPPPEGAEESTQESEK